MKKILLVPLSLLLALPAMAQTDNAPAAGDNGNPAPKLTPREKFQNADADHDGRLSPSEAQAMPFVARHFDAIDTNHDGYVSLDELKAARNEMKAMRAQRAGGPGQPGGHAPQPTPPPAQPGSGG